MPNEYGSLSAMQSFVNTFSDILTALSILNVPDLGEFILFRIAALVVDRETLALFKETLNDEPFPSVTQLLSFVKKRIKPSSSPGQMPGSACLQSQMTLTALLSCVNSNVTYLTVLQTALVHVRNGNVLIVPFCIMVDSRSQASAISSATVRWLNLHGSPYHGSLFGLSQSPLRQPEGCVVLSLLQLHSLSPVLNTKAVVLPHLPSKLQPVPLLSFIRSSVSHLCMVDPEFEKPNLVDLFPKIFLGEAEGFRGLSELPSLGESYSQAAKRFIKIEHIFKLYRQILITPEHQGFQHILWRDDSTHALQEFELNKVTYGVVSAPYLAIHTLHQLVNDKGEKFPLATQSLLRGTYIDDIITGANSVSNVQLIELLSLRGFPLGKWASNSQEL
ncbi:hypothetical protein J437_LFUL006618 [Ladona fulva]|uniref:Reverse transcriptase domain-containing protein n=1 Tax=Ladona fulva TaxID=123851 RepID=A0A8K0P5Q5_LADFU|nr:hypothetical protein J437_LFUL006618 [Ladona fulva]